MDSSMRERARASLVNLTDDDLVIQLEDGRVLQVPIEWFPKLLRATKAQRDNHKLVGRGVGIHWPDLDEDLSVVGLLLGRQVEQSTMAPAHDMNDGDDESPANGGPSGRYRRLTDEVR
jgi:hypothetical protein